MMQTNCEMGAVHATFLACAKRLQELVAAGDLGAVMAAMRAAKTHFGDTAQAMEDSDGVIEGKIKHSLGKKV